MSPALVWSRTTFAPLTFGGITVSDETATSVNVSWDPSAPAQGQVVYGSTPGGPYPYSTTLETSYLPAHVQAIGSLSAATTYYARIWGLTEDGRSAYSDEFTFATTSAGAFDDGMTYTSTTAWPTGTGWTAGALSTISANINALVASVGSGTNATTGPKHLPAAGAVYPIDTPVNLRPGGTPLEWVTFDLGGTDATTEPWGPVGGATISIATNSAGTSFGQSVFSGGVSPTYTFRGIRWHGGTLKGSGVNLATSTAGSQASEKQHGIYAAGGRDCLVDHMIFTDFMGDNIYLSESRGTDITNTSGDWCDGWEVRYSQMLRSGRQGIAPGQGARNLNFHHLYFADPAYSYVDFEGNKSYQGAENALLDDCVFAGKWAWMSTGGPAGQGLAVPAIFFTNIQVGTFGGYFRIRRNRVDGIEASPYYASTVRQFVANAPWDPCTFTGEVLIEDNVKTSATRAGPIVTMGRVINGPLTVRNNTGFWNGSGAWLSASGSVTPTQSGNT